MNRLAAIALVVASMFLIVMAILVNSSPLFYMTVAVAATLAASRLQAALSVRALRFDRSYPPAVSIGEIVTIETIVWSERKLRRPLVSIYDILPAGLIHKDRTPPVPVAPSFDQPIKTWFSFRPLRRGKFRWSQIIVSGTDALGLGTMERTYTIEPVQLSVYPVPIPVALEIRTLSGYGQSDIDSGLMRGSGLDPRGIREFTYGDPLRHIHWRSSAKTGRLMVKEFETGSGLSLAFFLQTTEGSEIGPPGGTTFEAMCGHALYVADVTLERGAYVWFPMSEQSDAMGHHAVTRAREIRELLIDVQATKPESLADQLATSNIPDSSSAVLFLAVADLALPQAIVKKGLASTVCLVYDPTEFDSSFSGQKASDPDYVRQLESAGAIVKVMPHVEVVS